MTEIFFPRLDILPAPQRRLWDELAAVPEGFVLYGGTAIALHLGHRQIWATASPWTSIFSAPRRWTQCTCYQASRF